MQMTNNLEQLNNLSEAEREEVLKILEQMSESGKSKAYNDLLLSDYEEIPVDIDTFLRDPKYLGSGLISDEGKFTVYAYWVETLRKIFPDPLRPAAYNTLALTGAIGLGKSFMAVLVGLYELYRMMCLKDPYVYYGLQPIDKITFAFMNITLDASKGVAWDKMQQLLQSSPWFMERGVVRGTANEEWYPPKGIELIAGSLSRHIIGRAVFFCLDGDTEIATTEGDFKIKDLEDKQIKVYTSDDNFKIVESEYCTVKQTAESLVEYRIELSDRTTIKCTPNHRFRLADGSYKEAQELTLRDKLVSYDSYIYITHIDKVTFSHPKKYYDVINADPYNNFLIKTNCGYICSHNCFMDEVSFQNNSSVAAQVEKAKTLVNTASARMQSRFMKNDVNPTIMVLASSKRTEQSYMETFIAGKKRTESKTTYVVDEPQWVIREDKNSDKKFKVAVGNKFLNSEVLPLDADEKIEKIYRDRGYSILEVPIGYYETFIDDIDIALTDVAGMSTSASSRYISGPRLLAVKKEELKNPFIRDVIEVGNAPEDTAQYYDFFDMNNVDPKMMEYPLYIHLDMSKTGDKTGIAGVWIKGKKPPVEGQPPSKELFYRLAFSVSIKAPKGYEISFEKNRQFIYWLKENNFNIKGISCDTYQSADLVQQLSARGYNVDIVSVDRVDTDKICKPYQYFKSTIYEERIEMYDSVLLTEEIIGLERDNNSGKVDHSPASINSKDAADAVCGATWNASKHGEEFNFEYGETLDAMVDVSNEMSYDNTRTQMVIDFEEELKKVSMDFSNTLNVNSNKNTNPLSSYGFGVDLRVDDLAMMDGIIL